MSTVEAERRTRPDSTALDGERRARSHRADHLDEIRTRAEGAALDGERPRADGAASLSPAVHDGATLAPLRASGLALTWARLFVHALAEAGVRHAVVSPGSRSTPLVLALAEQTRVACDVVIDERCAAFFALGIARASGEPVAVVCTSGTAGAHWFPAVLEAEASGVPLLLVTADRPWELQDAGALQTIDQTKLFSTHVRWSVELGTPSVEPNAMRAVMRVATQAVLRARAPQPGPVHVNARFRKPLEPTLTREPLTPWERDAEALTAMPKARASFATTAHDEAHVRAVAAEVAGKRGVIVCGPVAAHGSARAARRAVLALARASGFALSCEATSQARFGEGPGPDVTEVALVEALLAGDAAPEVIVQVGDMPTSAPYQRFVAAHPELLRVVLGPRTWGDPDGTAAHIVLGDPHALCTQLANVLTELAARVPSTPAGTRDRAHTPPAEPLLATPAATRTPVSAEPAATAEPRRVAPGSAFAEADVARIVIDALSTHAVSGSPANPTPDEHDEATVVVANSRCLRALDAFTPNTRVPLRVVHQRGVSGIDGMIAGAAGVRRAVRGPVALLLGDVAALHDLGGLAAARDVAAPLAIVIVDNGGGRIFEDLPLAGRITGAAMERFFVTPPRVDFAHAAHAFGLAYTRVESEAALAAALGEGLWGERATVIHAIVRGAS